MPRLIVTTRAGETRQVEGTVGLSLMENLRQNGFDEVQALCGGACSCATCHVYVDPDVTAPLPPMNTDEDDLLDSSEYRTEQSRLSCQILISQQLQDMHIVIAPED